MAKHFNTGIQVINYIKKNVPKYNPDNIFISKYKTNWGGVDVVIIVDCKLKHIKQIFNANSINALIQKLNNFYDTGVWEEFRYYQFVYSPNAMPLIANENVYQFPENVTVRDDKKFWELYNIEREKCPNGSLWFEEVCKPENNNYIPYQL